MGTPVIPEGIDLSMIPLGPPPPGVIPNFTDPVTLGGILVGVAATSSAIAFILLCIRLYSTIRVTRTFGSDDYTAITGFIFSLAYAIITIMNRHFARHNWDLPLSDYSASFLESIFVAVILAALGLLFAKISILILFLRIFSTNRVFRYLVYSALVLTVILHTTSILVDCVLCVPRSGESFSSQIVAARCTRSDVWSIISGTLEVFLDLWIFILPLPVIWKLKMSNSKKAGVSFIFMTALIACAASLLGLYYKIQFRTSDFLWNSFIVIICTMVDINVAIMVACMPACASFGRHIVSNGKSRTSISKSPMKSSIIPTAERTITSGSNGKYWRIRGPLVRETPAWEMQDGKQVPVTHNLELDLVKSKYGNAPYPEKDDLSA